MHFGIPGYPVYGLDVTAISDSNIQVHWDWDSGGGRESTVNYVLDEEAGGAQ